MRQNTHYSDEPLFHRSASKDKLTILFLRGAIPIDPTRYMRCDCALFSSGFLFWLPANAGNVGISLIAAYVCLPIAVLFLFMAIEVFLSAAADCFLTIETWPGGLTWERFGRTRYVFLDDVRYILNNGTHSHHYGNDTRRFFAFHIGLVDETGLMFGPYLYSSEDLVKTIENDSAPFLLARLRVKYKAGAKVDFGFIALSKSGWYKNGSFLPWQEVSRIRVDGDGWVCIENHNKAPQFWHVTSLNKIRNVHVLVLFLRELGFELYKEEDINGHRRG